MNQIDFLKKCQITGPYCGGLCVPYPLPKSRGGTISPQQHTTAHNVHSTSGRGDLIPNINSGLDTMGEASAWGRQTRFLVAASHST
jgi:hypothetical protein